MKRDADFFKLDIFGNSTGCTFSHDMKYRYVLYKIWDQNKPPVMFIGLNPSTATHEKPDPTITKVGKIAAFNGFGGFYMLNLFGWISPNPEDLLKAFDPIGNNYFYLEHYRKNAGKVVFCWGVFKEAREQATKVAKMFPEPYALKITKDGFPWHPLYCRDKTLITPYGKKSHNPA